MDTTRRTVSFEKQPQRSPESVLVTANRRLAASAYPALRRVSCEYCQGTVVLRGEVTSFYLKQLAQATVLAIPLVTAVVNRINVVDACRIVPPG